MQGERRLLIRSRIGKVSMGTILLSVAVEVLPRVRHKALPRKEEEDHRSTLYDELARRPFLPPASFLMQIF